MVPFFSCYCSDRFSTLLVSLLLPSFLLLIITTGTAAAGDVAAAVDVGTQRSVADRVTLALYSPSTTSAHENDCTSVVGLSMAFSLIYPAMTGSSASETAQVFGFLPFNRSSSTSSQELVWNATTEDWNTVYDGSCDDFGCTPDVTVANSVWVDAADTSILNEDYSELLQDVMFPVDFADAAAGSEVNAWVNETTRGLIDSIVEDGPLSPLILLAVNSIYLKANWASSFSPSYTNLDRFYSFDAMTVVSDQVHFMHQVAFYPYSDTALPGFQLIQLPFARGDLSMVVALPTTSTGNMASSTAVLNAVPLLNSSRVALGLPKFEFASTYKDSLKEVLQQLGLKAPFAGEICVYDTCDAFIELVIQKTFVAVDEEGVEAAAVTAIGVRENAPTEQAVLFLADRPFQFFIYDAKTEYALFEGRVGNPIASDAAVVPVLDTKHASGDFWSSTYFIEEPVVVDFQDVADRVPTPSSSPTVTPEISSSKTTSSSRSSMQFVNWFFPGGAALAVLAAMVR